MLMNIAEINFFLKFHFFQKRGAQLVVLEGKRREVWENTWTQSCIDLHLMSSGAARAMVHAWLLNIRSTVFEGHELPKLLRLLFYSVYNSYRYIIGLMPNYKFSPNSQLQQKDCVDS